MRYCKVARGSGEKENIGGGVGDFMETRVDETREEEKQEKERRRGNKRKRSGGEKIEEIEGERGTHADWEIFPQFFMSSLFGSDWVG